MVQRNHNIAKLQSGYLFPEINRRKKLFLEKNPDAKIISLGIGNTTEPLTPYITQALEDSARKLGTLEGYSGYGDEQGNAGLRRKIARTFYGGVIEDDEVFISDGAKCDIGRLQLMFGNHAKIAVQDPVYPVYVDGSVISGATGEYNPEDNKRCFGRIHYMPCTPENGFFPDISKIPQGSLIYFCSPNNPTGAVAAREQLKGLVELAKKNKSIIIFDASYAEYIEDDNIGYDTIKHNALPKTIYEIEGSKEVAIEVNSFSKTLGFTGVRLGWSIVPKGLKYDDGSMIWNDWNRIETTLFNGASNVVQDAALKALDPAGLKEMRETIEYYKANARIIKSGLESLGIECYGGINSPYIWAHFPGKSSWEVFNDILERCHVVVTPGSGFGQSGEEFVRFSSYSHRENVIEAVERLKKMII
jgi:LL-diaminopimelate aminotransferase